jgi:hypothetical protein
VDPWRLWRTNVGSTLVSVWETSGAALGATILAMLLTVTVRGWSLSRRSHGEVHKLSPRHAVITTSAHWESNAKQCFLNRFRTT